MENHRTSQKSRKAQKIVRIILDSRLPIQFTNDEDNPPIVITDDSHRGIFGRIASMPLEKIEERKREREDIEQSFKTN